MREPEEEGEYHPGQLSDRFKSKKQQLNMNHPISSNSSITSAISRSSASLPRSVLRKGKFDVSRRARVTRPLLDLSVIYDLFGENATLYHVLGVDPTASAADIRRAYVRQGRATLLHGSLAFTDENAPRNLDDFPEMARKKFQAISIAYEVLSIPELRSDYDWHGVVYAQSSSSCRTDASSESRCQNGVRWKEYVEEKIIIDSHPDEHSRGTGAVGAPKEQHTATAPKATEYGWLGSHFRGIDKETEKFLKGDFLDKFDEGIVKLQQSFGSLIGSIGTKESTETKRSGFDVASVASNGGDLISVDESKPNIIVEQLHAKEKLFHKEHHMTVEPYKGETNGRVQNEQPSGCDSPCSVAAFSPWADDVTKGSNSMWNLSESFSNMLGSDDKKTACSER